MLAPDTSRSAPLDTVTLLFLSILPAVAIAAALKDLTTMTIPNWMSLVLILGFFPAAWLVGLSGMEVLVHAGVAMAALFVGAGLFALRALGGGDAKLMASASLWMGLAGAPAFILWTAVIGGLFSLVLMMVRAQASVALIPGPSWLTRLLQPKADIPYGVAIAAGVLMAFPSSPMVVSFAAGL